MMATSTKTDRQSLAEACPEEGSVTLGDLGAAGRLSIRLCDAELSEILWASPVVEDIWQRPAASFVGARDRWVESIHPEDRDAVLSAAGQLPDTATDLVYRILRPDGSRRYVREWAVPLRREGREPLVVALSLDVTKEREEKDAAAASSEVYRTIVERASEGLWFVDASWRTTLANEPLAALLGEPPASLLGRMPADLVHPDDRSAWEAVAARIDLGVAERGELRLVRRDGAFVWASLAVQPILSPEGRFEGAVAVVTDVTARRSAEVALEGHSARLELLHEIDEALLGACGARRIAETALARLVALTGAAQAEVSVLDRDRGEAVVLATAGAATETTAPAADLGSPCGPAFQAEVSLPLTADGGGLVGHLTLRFRPGGAPPPDRLEVVTEVANHLAVALEQARLRESLEEKAVALARLERDRRRNEQRLLFTLELSQRAAGLSEKELIDLTLEHAVTLSESQIGHLHLMGDDQQTLYRTAWSPEALVGCSAPEQHPLSSASVWADCVRLREPVIHNDLQAPEGRKGHPEGNGPVARQASVPVFDGDQVRMVLGVGNKSSDYDTSDTNLLQAVAADLLRVLLRRRAEEKLRRHAAHLEILRDVDGALLRAQTREQIAFAAVSRLRALVDCDRAFLALASEAGDEGLLLAADPDEGRLRSVPLSGADAASFFSGENHLLPDLSSDPAPADNIRALTGPGYLSAATVPLRSAPSTTIGRLGVAWQVPTRIEPEPLGVLNEVADHLAIALEQLRLREKLATRAAELTETNELLRAVMDGTSDTVFVKDTDGRYVFLNRAGTEQANLSAAEVIGRTDHELFPESTAEAFASHTRQALASEGARLTLEYPVDLGGPKAYQTTLGPYRNRHGEIAGVVGIARDVTGRRETERRLEASFRRYQSLVESIDGIVWEMDVATSRFTFVSERSVDLLGIPPADWTDAAFWSQRIHPEDRQDAVTFCQEQAKLGQDHDFEYRFLAASGRHVWLRDLVTVESEAGRPVRMRGVMIDVTARKDAEEALRQRNERLGILREIDEAILRSRSPMEIARAVLSRVGRLVRAEGSSLSLLEEGSVRVVARDGTGDSWPGGETPFRLTEEDRRLLDDPAGLLVPDLGSRASLPPTLRLAPPDVSCHASIPLHSARGHVLGYLSAGSPGAFRFGTAELGLLSEVASLLAVAIDQSQLRAALVSARQRFEGLVDAIDGIVWEGDPATYRVRYVSRQTERILGFPPERWIEDPGFWPGLIHPEDRERVKATHRTEVAACRSHVVDYRMVARDGRTLHVRDHVSVTCKNGVPAAVRGIIVDVTAEQEAALALSRSQEQLRSTQKMEAIGRMAGGVAHDFNNLLTAIVGSTRLLSLHVGGLDSARRHLDTISSAADRAAELTNQLLAISSRQPVEPKVLDVRVSVTEISRLLDRLLGPQVELVTRLSPEPLHVKADPAQLTQILLNLAVNARDAMPAGGRLTIEAGGLPAGRGLPGPLVRLAVSDTGAGMDEATLSRAFEPFFTTKTRGAGTGLGLSIVHGVVEQCGGRIHASSSPLRGTTFEVLLPRVAGRPDEAFPRPSTDVAPPAAETILVVEDGELLRSVIRDVLQEAGFRVLACSGGDEALEIVTRTPDLDLVLTDVQMPQLGGRELAARLRACGARPRILLMSGYAAAESRAASDGPVLQKPFTPEQLFTKVRETLRRPPNDPGLEARETEPAASQDR